MLIRDGNIDIYLFSTCDGLRFLFNYRNDMLDIFEQEMWNEIVECGNVEWSWRKFEKVEKQKVGNVHIEKSSSRDLNS